MAEIASKQQLRMSFLRWAVVTVPFVLLLGFLSSRFVPSGSQSSWYQALAKSPATPPDWVFPVAWGLLYAAMGLALAMVLNARGARMRGLAIVLFALQLLANLVWSPLFFGAHQVLNALVLLGVIFVLALATTLVFARIRTMAGWILVPYLAWLCFAAALNWDILKLNPHAETLVPASSSAQMQI
jgi:translocator protein